MHQYIAQIEPNRFSAVLKKLRRDPAAALADENLHLISLRTSNIKKYASIRGIKIISKLPASISIRSGRRRTSRPLRLDPTKTKNVVMFLGIDGSISPDGSSITDTRILSHLADLDDLGIWVYIATERSLTKLFRLLHNHSSIQDESIAENGGIIIGFGKNGFEKFGDNYEPHKVLGYVKRNYGTIEAMRQGQRITEVIFLQDAITEAKLRRAIKSTRAKVDIHKSKDSFHISTRGINKWTAIKRMTELKFMQNPTIITVGDSQMDVPMLEHAYHSFAPSTGDKHALAVCKETLRGSYADALGHILSVIRKAPRTRTRV